MVSHKVSLLATDGRAVYYGLKEYSRQTVHREIGQYVLGTADTNTVGGVRSIFIRGLVDAVYRIN